MNDRGYSYRSNYRPNNYINNYNNSSSPRTYPNGYQQDGVYYRHRADAPQYSRADSQYEHRDLQSPSSVPASSGTPATYNHQQQMPAPAALAISTPARQQPCREPPASSDSSMTEALEQLKEFLDNASLRSSTKPAPQVLQSDVARALTPPSNPHPEVLAQPVSSPDLSQDSRRSVPPANFLPSLPTFRPTAPDA